MRAIAKCSAACITAHKACAFYTSVNWNPVPTAALGHAAGVTSGRHITACMTEVQPLPCSTMPVTTTKGFATPLLPSASAVLH